VSTILCAAVLTDELQVLVYGLWNARFLLQLSTIHFKFPLCAIALLDEKDLHLMGPHCPIHPLKANKVHTVEHLLHSSSVLQKFHLSGYEVW